MNQITNKISNLINKMKS